MEKKSKIHHCLEGENHFGLQDVNENCLKKKNPWSRKNVRLRTPLIDDNAFPDSHTKKAVLKISSSVVTLISYTGDLMLNQCSGVIIEYDGNNEYIVLTSANLIRCHPTNKVHKMGEYVLADSLKITIGMWDGGSHTGVVCAYDFHYNLAWIKFRSDSSHATAKLRDLNDIINVNPSMKKKPSFHLSPYSNNIVPGDSIIAVGRHFAPPYDLMAAPGNFILARHGRQLDCQELFMGTCQISKYGDGGVTINIFGEIIGITIYYTCNIPTPFLPINIALRCWENYKTYGKLRRPSLGFRATNLYAASIYAIEKIIKRVPSVCNGVIVEQVIPGSYADCAGLQSNDVIVQCDRKTVQSFLEFMNEVLKTKAGDELLLSVVRVDENDLNDLIHLRTVISDVAAEKFNRWPQKLRKFRSYDGRTGGE